MKRGVFPWLSDLICVMKGFNQQCRFKKKKFEFQVPADGWVTLSRLGAKLRAVRGRSARQTCLSTQLPLLNATSALLASAAPQALPLHQVMLPSHWARLCLDQDYPSSLPRASSVFFYGKSQEIKPGLLCSPPQISLPPWQLSPQASLFPDEFSSPLEVFPQSGEGNVHLDLHYFPLKSS